MYVVAWGRSGTTILGNILGSLVGAFDAGELRHFWRYSDRSDRICGCGKPLAVCPFWQAVRRSLFTDTDLPTHDLAAIHRWQRQATRVRNIRRVVGTAPLENLGGEEFANTVRALGCLYRAIAKVSGAEVIIDSSKKASYGALAGLSLEGSIQYIHLIRDPRATAFSWRRVRSAGAGEARIMPRHSALASSLNWMLSNLSTESLFRNRWSASARLRYEDLVRSPRSVVGELAETIGRDRPRDLFVADNVVKLPLNHSIGGNPSRLRHGDIELLNDDEWIWRQSRSDRLVCDVVTFPLMRRYGYRLRVE